MQIDWNSTINDILGDKVACLRCGSLTSEIVVGYSRSPAANDWSPRVHDCANKEECDARRLVVVCEQCARDRGGAQGMGDLRARHDATLLWIRG